MKCIFFEQLEYLLYPCPWIAAMDYKGGNQILSMLSTAHLLKERLDRLNTSTLLRDVIEMFLYHYIMGNLNEWFDGHST